MRRIVVIALCIIPFLAQATSAMSATAITLRSEAGIESAVVRLGDIADIVGDDSHERTEELRSVTICSAPPPAEAQVLTASAVVSALGASGVDLSGLELAGSPQVIVTREHDLVSVGELANAFAGHVAERAGWPEDSFVVKAPKNLRSIPVPVGERAVGVETSPGEDFHGSILARFQVIVDGEPYRVLAHRFTVERYVEALTAARKVSRGQQLSASDVTVTKIEQSLLDDDSLLSAEQAVGLVARRTIQAGRVLRADMLTPSPVVRRGEFKSVMCAGNGFEILTRGRVLENGSTDEIVRVRLPSKKIVKAVVVDSQTLRMIRQGE